MKLSPNKPRETSLKAQTSVALRLAGPGDTKQLNHSHECATTISKQIKYCP